MAILAALKRSAREDKTTRPRLEHGGPAGSAEAGARSVIAVRLRP
jgi:hypothetical protein